MAKFVMIERIAGEPEDAFRSEDVSDFAEATWFLTKELHDTCDTTFGTEILRDWLNLDRDSEKVHEVSKAEPHHNRITYTFRYDPS